jgi:hypothetical protein
LIDLIGKMDEEGDFNKSHKSRHDKYKGFNVPSKSCRRHKSTPWGYHVYHMIKEAKPELLEREDVRQAYNNLIDCLRKYEGQLESWAPNRYHKYKIGIKLAPYEHSELQSIPARFFEEYHAINNPDLKLKLKEQAEDIVNSYIPLYDLIKRDVVPYMEMKQHEIDKAEWLKLYKYRIEKLESKILYWEDCIEEAQKQILECAEKMLAKQAPPVFSTFE